MRRSRRLAVAVLLLCGTLASQLRIHGGFPEGQAAIEELLLHFDPVVAGSAFPAVRDLLRAVPAEVQVRLAVENENQVAAARFWVQDLGLNDRIRYVVAGRTLTPWARDRMVPVQVPAGTLFLSPPEDHVDADRWGDVLAARALSEVSADTNHARVPLVFEGGNLLFTRERVLFTRSLLTANQVQDDIDEASILERMRAFFGRKPLPLGRSHDLPHDHLDMFLTVVDDRTVLLGDPKEAEQFLIDVTMHGLDAGLLPQHDRWTVQGQRAKIPAYDSIKDELQRAGFRVLRVPILHGAEAMLTWNNALLELRGKERRAYVPVHGLPRLDARALRAFEAAGCRTFPIDVSRIAPLGGTIRCLTNVTRWRCLAPPPVAPTVVREGPAR